MVGAHLLYDLVSKGEKVRALKRPGSSMLRTEKIFSYYNIEYQSLLQNIEWVDGDLLDKDVLRDLLVGVDLIYHIAAMVSFDPRDCGSMIHNNVEGTANLVDLALLLKIPRFCHVSSISAIGTPPEGIESNEEHPWRNNMDHSAYSQSKYLSEMEVWRAIFEGLNAVIVNPSVIVGPGDWKSGSSMIFSTVRKGMNFYTRGGNGFVDVRDVTAAMQLLTDEKNWENVKNQRFILNAKNVTFHDFFNQCADELNVKRPKFLAGNLLLNLAFRLSSIKSYLTGINSPVTRDTARSAVKSSYFDGSKICRTIGFEYTPVEISIHNYAQLFLKDFVIS